MNKKYFRTVNNYIKNLGVDETINIIKDFYFDDSFSFKINSPEGNILAAYLNYSSRNDFDLEAKIVSFLNYYYYKSK